MYWTFAPLPYPADTHYGFYIYLVVAGALVYFIISELLKDKLYGVSGFIAFIFVVSIFIGYDESFYPTVPLNEKHVAEFIDVRPEQEHETYKCGPKLIQTCHRYTSVVWGEFKLESGNSVWVKINPAYEMPKQVILYKQNP